MDKVKVRNSSRIIVENINTPLSIMGRTLRQKINKEIENLNSMINELDLMYTEHSTQQHNTHFSQLHMEHSPGQIIC